MCGLQTNFATKYFRWCKPEQVVWVNRPVYMMCITSVRRVLVKVTSKYWRLTSIAMLLPACLIVNLPARTMVEKLSPLACSAPTHTHQNFNAQIIHVHACMHASANTGLWLGVVSNLISSSDVHDQGFRTARTSRSSAPSAMNTTDIVNVCESERCSDLVWHFCCLALLFCSE